MRERFDTARRRPRTWHLLVIVGCALALVAPARAHGLALRAVSPLPLTTDVVLETTSTDQPGLGLLYADGVFMAQTPVSASQPATFASVSFTPGPHRLTAVVRSRSGLAACPPVIVETWGTPSPPSPRLTLRGLWPASVTLPVRAEGATTLSVLVDGTCVAKKPVADPSTVAMTFALPRGAHQVELRASNPLASSCSKLVLTRPLWPVPGCTRITSYFGWRVHPILGTRRFHAGLDIAAPSGSRVIATGAATVRSAGVNGGYGNCIVLDHGGGVTTLHGHLSRIDVKAGQQVAIGQRIGLVGTTGLSTGPHLHYEIQLDGAPVDPLGYL